jgi:uncharacterized repeat protein (TIGR01451 family)
MARLRRLTLCMLLGLAGCNTSNPSYFPYLWPTGDANRTHAKPTGSGYFADFDPHARRLEVRPAETTAPVGQQCVLIATVYDEKDEPRRKRRVEWMVEGVGNIVEVDESGYMPGRGLKVENRYAISYTDYFEHTITRGNDNPADDFVIRPGQSWCVITSAVPGDTKVTVYAPEIHNWDARKTVVTLRWCDAGVTFPAAATVRLGGEAALLTKLDRRNDPSPLSEYRIRYRLLEGPPAAFTASRSNEAVVGVDTDGTAKVSLAQLGAKTGKNRVAVEVVKPASAVKGGTGEVVVSRGETTVDWQGPQLNLKVLSPASLGRDQELLVTYVAENNGTAETDPLTLRAVIPEGAEFIRSDPEAKPQGNQLVWSLAGLPGGKQSVVQAAFKLNKLGPLTANASLLAPDGARTDGSALSQVIEPALKVAISGPETVVVGEPITYRVSVVNPGSGPAANVRFLADFDPKLSHATKANPYEVTLGTLKPGEDKDVPLVLTARQPGKLVCRAAVTGENGLQSNAECTVEAKQPQIDVKLTGPARKLVNEEAVWTLTVRNTGQLPLTDVVLRDTLPAEVTFKSAKPEARAEGRNVQWNVGSLQPNEEKTFEVTAACAKPAAKAASVAVVSAGVGGKQSVEQRAESPLEILGVPTLSLETSAPPGPVEVGAKARYGIRVQNTGTLTAAQVVVVATVPKELKPTRGDGPVPAKVDGQTVTFAPIDALAPGKSVVFTVDVDAVAAGDARFKAELRSQTLAAPVFKVEATQVVPAGGK